VRAKASSPWKTKDAMIIEPVKYYSSGIFIFPDVSARGRGQLSKHPVTVFSKRSNIHCDELVIRICDRR
jgi:hypothetical protein